MCPVWLLVVAVLLGGKGAAGQCWEHPSCQELNSESSMLECIQLCRSDLTAETTLIPGDAHLQPPSPSEPDSADAVSPFSPSSPQAKRSYSMEHFRWGKPVGRKRRPVKLYTSNDVEEVSPVKVYTSNGVEEESPVKVYTSNGMEEESAEVFPEEMRRRQLGEAAENEVQEETEEEALQLLHGSLQEKKDDGSYKMSHFRWGGPPASKRQGGGFMKVQKPLLSLFKNVINKDGQHL